METRDKSRIMYVCVGLSFYRSPLSQLRNGAYLECDLDNTSARTHFVILSKKILAHRLYNCLMSQSGEHSSIVIDCNVENDELDISNQIDI